METFSENLSSPNPFPAPRHGVPSLVLAPMEGITDAPMRAVLTECGGFDFCVTEFLRVTDRVPPRKVFFRHFPELARGARTLGGVPVQLQLLGSDAEILAATAAAGVALGVRAIDINFGCPAPTVNRHEGGAVLLRHPDRIYRILTAVRAALPPEIPLSAKMRLGWDTKDPIFENARVAESAGIAWLTIHGRTRMAGYAPPADWATIGEVRSHVRIPVVANGEVWSLEDLRRCRELSGCEHFMLGRGALADPQLATKAARWLRHDVFEAGARFPRDPETWCDLFRALQTHSTLPPDADDRFTNRLKQWAFFAGKPYGKLEWFDRIKLCRAYSEVLDALGKPHDAPRLS